MKRKTAKELLAESFRELAQERDIDRITVQDIAKTGSLTVEKREIGQESRKGGYFYVKNNA